jgi:hypothetical protein
MLKGCLGWTLLWRLNMLPKYNGWEREIFGPKENCEEEFGVL